jgi:ornithine carbamoyltransferase
MMPKDLLTLLEFSGEEVLGFLSRAKQLKAELKSGRAHEPCLKGKTIVLIFQKPSLRTRVTFETGIFQLGGNPIYLAPDSIQIGKRETPYDAAKNLERWVNGVVARTFSHGMQEELARNASIPLINALSDEHHPCQALATGLTLLEHFNRLKGLRVCFVGDGNNVAVSLLILCAKLGIHFTHTCPKGYDIPEKIIKSVSAEIRQNGCDLKSLRDPKEAVRDADMIYTDVWVSMGQEKEAAKKLKAFKPYQVNAKLVSLAPKGVKISHCLPAHRGEEAASDVLDSAACVMFDEAENRLHVQKAVMSVLMGAR